MPQCAAFRIPEIAMRLFVPPLTPLAGVQLAQAAAYGREQRWLDQTL
jgi:hypothetical protein